MSIQAGRIRAFVAFAFLLAGLAMAGSLFSGSSRYSGLPAAQAQRQAESESAERARLRCERVKGRIAIDGRADERAWQQAVPIESFTVPWLPRAAATSTSARLLWDDEYLYFAAQMQDADLYADVVERDGQCWLNDVFELFFQPDASKLAYYEFQVNAAGTQLDIFIPSRGSGGFGRWAKARPFAWETAALLDGTLNDIADKDQGWSVEGRLPWSDFQPTGGRPAAGDVWRFALCRYDYSIEFSEPDLTSCAPLSRPDFHRYEDYLELEFAGE